MRYGRRYKSFVIYDCTSVLKEQIYHICIRYQLLCRTGESSPGLRGTSSEKHLGEAMQGKLEEASTHKSAKTHAGSVFMTRGLDL